MECKKYDNIIIGAGPAGMRACAIARQLGETVCVIERHEVGGTCLNRGCIPTKALVQSASVVSTVFSASEFGVEVDGDVRVDYSVASMRKDKVIEALRHGAALSLGPDSLLKGEASLLNRNIVKVGDEMLQADKRIIIATGSSPARLGLPGNDLALTSDDFLRLDTLPADMVVIGGGVIGMECACIAYAFGCKVTVIEYCREILPGLDGEMAKRLRSMLSRRGIDILTGASVMSLSQGISNNVDICYADRRGEHTVSASMVLMATGRRPVIPDGAEAIGMDVSHKGIVVDDSMATSVPGVYAVGDCNGRLMLAHAATAQAEVAMGVRDSISHVPSVVFTSPECAQVGIVSAETPGRLIVGKSMYGANGMAASMGRTEGFVKVALDADSHRIAGCCAIGAGADAIVQEAAVAMSAGYTAGDLRSRVVFAHPTLSELLLSALPG